MRSSQAKFELCIPYCTIIHSIGERYKVFVMEVVENSSLAAFSWDCGDCGHAMLDTSRLKELVPLLPECGNFCSAGMIYTDVA